MEAPKILPFSALPKLEVPSYMCDLSFTSAPKNMFWPTKSLIRGLRTLLFIGSYLLIRQAVHSLPSLCKVFVVLHFVWGLDVKKGRGGGGWFINLLGSARPRYCTYPLVRGVVHLLSASQLSPGLIIMGRFTHGTCKMAQQNHFNSAFISRPLGLLGEEGGG